MALVNNHSDHVKRLAWNILRGCLEINSSQILSISKFTSPLWMFIRANPDNRSSPIVLRRKVFVLRNAENARSASQLVIGNVHAIFISFFTCG